MGGCGSLAAAEEALLSQSRRGHTQFATLEIARRFVPATERRPIAQKKENRSLIVEYRDLTITPSSSGYRLPGGTPQTRQGCLDRVEGKLEPPHRHKQAFEFQYMTAGLTAYLDLTTAEEHVFRKGDFYVIEPGAVYAQKSAPGTEILFIKVPPGNDKVPVDITPEVEAWFREPIKE